MRVLVSAVLVAGVLSTAAEAAVRTAASCSRTDVQSAINAAGDGDTVVIPAGTCTWPTNLTIDGKSITLQGAGIDSTILVDGVSKGNFPNIPQMLLWRTKNVGVSRLTGLTVQGGSIPDAYNKGSVWFEGNSKQVRVDHVKFTPTQTSALHFHGNLQGVLDHCQFQENHFGVFVYVHHESWNDQGDFGDSSWASPAPLGTPQAMFIEDNVFDSSAGGAAVDGWSGGRVVFRNNTARNVGFSNHGTETSGRWRGQRTFEVYNNTMTYDSFSWGAAVNTRGGTGVVFNNTTAFSGTGWLSSAFDVNEFRQSDHSRTYTPWGFCDGSNIWDGNQLPSGYPCLDQAGRGQVELMSGDSPTPQAWPKQAVEPIYAWNNTLNGLPDPVANGSLQVIAPNRDFFDTSKPGYTPYVYPHPLVTGQAAPTVPSAPTNLRIPSP